MIDVLNLALPYFGLIFTGFASGKLKQIPDTPTAQQYDTWVTQASGVVLIGTLISVLTLTSVMWMVRTHTLPALLFG
jgi:predicted permease